MKPMSLEQKLRCGSVTRWHIVRTSVRQSVAEHQFNVAIIAKQILREVAVQIPQMHHFCTTVVARLVHMAIHHDIEEPLTGDIPTPAKKWMRGAMNTEGMDRGIAELRIDDMAPDYANHTGLLSAIVKMADLLDAWRFLHFYSVDTHGKMVMCELAEALSRPDQFMPVVEFEAGQVARKVNWGLLVEKLKWQITETPADIGAPR